MTYCRVVDGGHWESSVSAHEATIRKTRLGVIVNGSLSSSSLVISHPCKKTRFYSPGSSPATCRPLVCCSVNILERGGFRNQFVDFAHDGKSAKGVFENPVVGPVGVVLTNLDCLHSPDRSPLPPRRQSKSYMFYILQDRLIYTVQDHSNFVFLPMLQI